MKFLRNLALLGAGALALYFGVVTVLILVYSQVDPPVSTLMVVRALGGTKVVPPKPLPYAKIPGVAKRGIVFLEDHDFWTHHGVVPEAIGDAYKANQRAGRVTHGGSTITQQLARTLFLFPERMYLRKALEAGTALWMEVLLSKERILELYLNNIEWGPGVFGIEAGARYQFGTGVRNLDKEQLARLEAIVTNPLVYTVKTYYKNGGMAARYEALMAR
jgi:monofunctional biosynthetic peptidoglycan transglycosylase